MQKCSDKVKRNKNDEGQRQLPYKLTSQENKFCYNCGREGHKYMKCPENETPGEQVDEVKQRKMKKLQKKEKPCKICKEDGHKVRDCPLKTSKETKKFTRKCDAFDAHTNK